MSEMIKVDAFYIRNTDKQVFVSLMQEVMHPQYEQYALPLSQCTFDQNLDHMDENGYEPNTCNVPVWLRDKLELWLVD